MGRYSFAIKKSRFGQQKRAAGNRRNSTASGHLPAKPFLKRLIVQTSGVIIGTHHQKRISDVKALFVCCRCVHGKPVAARQLSIGLARYDSYFILRPSWGHAIRFTKCIQESDNVQHSDWLHHDDENQSLLRKTLLTCKVVSGRDLANLFHLISLLKNDLNLNSWIVRIMPPTLVDCETYERSRVAELHAVKDRVRTASTGSTSDMV